MKVFSMLLFTTIFIAPQICHPLLLTLILLTATMIIVIMSGTLLASFWMSYVLLLIFLGALLVLFIYITTLIPNETFNKIYFNPLLLLIIMFLSPSIISLDTSFFLLAENMDSMKKIFYLTSIPVTLMLIFSLFYLLMMTMKITNTNIGPLQVN